MTHNAGSFGPRWALLVSLGAIVALIGLSGPTMSQNVTLLDEQLDTTGELCSLPTTGNATVMCQEQTLTVNVGGDSLTLLPLQDAFASEGDVSARLFFEYRTRDGIRLAYDSIFNPDDARNVQSGSFYAIDAELSDTDIDTLAGLLRSDSVQFGIMSANSGDRPAIVGLDGTSHFNTAYSDAVLNAALSSSSQKLPGDNRFGLIVTSDADGRLRSAISQIAAMQQTDLQVLSKGETQILRPQLRPKDGFD